LKQQPLVRETRFANKAYCAILQPQHEPARNRQFSVQFCEILPFSSPLRFFTLTAFKLALAVSLNAAVVNILPFILFYRLLFILPVCITIT